MKSYYAAYLASTTHHEGLLTASESDPSSLFHSGDNASIRIPSPLTRSLTCHMFGNNKV